ncbi:hypothetical protein DFH07DRAFT_589022 [Mycena maculata]|uniref:BRCT domain-containing protein n=1 Tax=Mycena maculata TaxID=230809 RepID=A0AAD7IMR7_9AGAR|nr:hypothetical protein DFH07DRAFT_589022 [Mycena maculata]
MSNSSGGRKRRNGFRWIPNFAFTIMLFDGIACFSPSVPGFLRSAWVKHGGSLTHSKEDFYRASVFFCEGPHDPWLKELLSRSLIVRHARWISKSVSEEFAVPVSKYLLDDQFDPTKIEPVHAPRMPLGPTNALNLTDSPLPRDEPRNPTKLNALKRSLDSEYHDASLTEIDPRPLKRARIQSASSPQPPLASPDPQRSPRASSISISTASTEVYPSPASSSPLKTPNPPPSNPHAAEPVVPLPRIDFITLKSARALSFPRPRSTRLAGRCVNDNRYDDAPQLEYALLCFDPMSDLVSRTDRLPRTSVAELLRHPRADACAFVVSETYRQKAFSSI